MKEKLKTLVTFIKGWRVYLKTGQTPFPAYLAMRSLYFDTNGRLFDLIWFCFRLAKPKTHLTAVVSGYFKDFDRPAIVREIRRNGIMVFPEVLPKAVCEELKKYALETPCNPRMENAEGSVLFDKNNLRSNIYDFDQDILLKNTLLQELVLDKGIYAIAQSYLGLDPVFHNLAMWWSTSNFERPDLSSSAQLFHTDLDTIQWLNIFIYLTDVSEKTGPHIFVKGSHRRKPKQVQRDGRIPDDEVALFYPPSSILEITGKAGTVVMADTKALHKGKPLIHGDRLMLQLRFSVTRFGNNYTPAKDPETWIPQFRAHRKDLPRTFAGFFDE